MTENPPGVFDLAKASLSSTAAALRAMPLLFALYFTVGVASGLILKPMLEGAPGAPPSFAVMLATTPLDAFLTAIFAVAIHRFVILEEISDVASLTARRAAILEFFAVTFAFSLVSSVLALMAIGRETPPWVVAPIAIAVIFVLLRLFLIFPAIAVEAPGRSFLSAYRWGWGLILRCIGAGLTIALPVVLLQALIVTVLGLKQWLPGGAVALDAAVNVFIMAIWVTIASHLFLFRRRSLEAARDARNSASGYGRRPR